MIHAAVQAYATALVARLPVPDPVMVYDHRPENVAGPAVWVQADAVSWRTNTWRVTVVARCLAPQGLAPVDETEVRSALADAALDAARALGGAEGVTARPTTVDMGGVSYPVYEVATPLVYSQCDLPDPAVFALLERT